MEFKQCATCKRVLPIANFSTSTRTADGFRCQCNKCVEKEALKRQIKKTNKITQQGVKATFRISDFDDNMLVSELRRRGFTGEIKYTKTITL